jgi:hypothetical protein
VGKPYPRYAPAPMRSVAPKPTVSPRGRRPVGSQLSFTTPGTYRFGTKVLPMNGMPEVETIGPDNTLKLTVTVA